MLILTEKPSVSSAFAAALGVPKKAGFFENDEYCIVNALGHLLENFAPEDYDPALKKWSLQTLPVIPEQVKFKPVQGAESQLALVKKCFDARKDDVLLLATDAEREGELIGAEILGYVGFRGYDSARRFWVSAALTPDVILAGIKNARPLSDYDPYKEQGYARQEADWLTGMNLTRLLSVKSGKLLHFGRVQTAVLAAVHDREQAVKGFTPEKYAEAAALLDAGFPFSVKLLNQSNEEFPSRFPDQSPLLAEIKEKKDSLKSGRITELKKEKKTLRPPQLFNLTALQKEASKKFSYTPEQTLTIAQALYEKHKCLSYPRTPSRVMGDENAGLVSGIYENLKGVYPEMSEGTDPALISAGNKRIFNSAELEDHHALIPLAPLPDGASPEEANVFNLVLNQFFTILMPDFVYNAIKIAVDISGFPFAGNGAEVLQAGWKQRREKDDDEDEEENYAGLEEQGVYPVSSITMAEKFTEPKKHYTYASLLALMENPRGDDGKHLAGLGTPATRGSILKKLTGRGYLLQKGKNILISDDGIFLIENIKKNEFLANFISIPETTRWEQSLHENTAQFLRDIKTFVRSAVEHTSVETWGKKSLGKCPRCGGDIYDGKRNYYCANYKEGCQFAIWKEICQAAISLTDVQALLAGKKTKIKKCKSKAGKEFRAAFELANGKVEMRFDDKKI
ncbi:MAG: topoisomerase C-terminal repeat-containing protein [Spirochaetaceae bacterium]|jgi:DNA topoisomerase-3|nr:topoisomerase C-terminal repeat-containing protein [Spirochaetaceae bacterium]